MRITCPALYLLLFFACNGIKPALAQLRIGNPKNDKQTVFAIPPREATRPLKIAEKSIKKGEFEQATQLLGDLLADSMLNEYLIAGDDQWGRAVSLRQRAEQLLGEIPLDLRTSYQEKYGVKAKVMLRKAIEANDTEAIAMTSRLYFHTDAGLEATMLVGHTHLAEGRPAMAAVAFEKVATQPQGSNRFDPEATLLAAISWSLNGSTDRSDKLLLALKEEKGDAQVRFYGKTVALFEQRSPQKSESVAQRKDRLSKQKIIDFFAENGITPLSDPSTSELIITTYRNYNPLASIDKNSRTLLKAQIGHMLYAELEEQLRIDQEAEQVYRKRAAEIQKKIRVEEEAGGLTPERYAKLLEELIAQRKVAGEAERVSRRRFAELSKKISAQRKAEGETESSNDLFSNWKTDASSNQEEVQNRGNGKSTVQFDQNTPLQNWLKEIVDSTPLESHPIVNQWLVYRGDAKRNAESGSGFPLLSPRWSIRTVTDPVDEEGIQAFQQKLIQSNVSPMPKVHPLAIGKTLVIRTDDRMFGVDADNGKRMWSYPPANMFRSGQQKSEDSLGRPSRKLHQDKLRERLWLDSLYGQISSDGDSIFLIPNPGISTDRDDWRSYQRQVYDEPTDLRLYNELKSLDLKQQGALQWQVGGESGLDEPKLAKSFFLGAPLPIHNQLYAICVQETSVRLVVLDSETGRLQWSRYLASTEEAVSFREERLRRLAGATPSESNGVLVCPTGLNAIVAVDLATQALKWGFQFKVPQRKRVAPLNDNLNKWDTMWRDATVTLAGGAVVYTPIDSEEIYCLNLQTGESLWKDKKKKSRGKYKAMHVETVRSRNIIITSSDRLKAINIKNGTVTWETRLEDFGLVSGRGYISGNHCFVPTTSKKVLRIDTATGKIDGVVMTEKVLGNLISFRGDVISHGADHLTAYPRDEPSRLMLAQGMDPQIKDHSRLSIEAQLHLIDGQYEQSVDAISQAYDLFPNSNYAKVLVQALTRLINVDFEKAEQVSNRYQDLFEKQDLHRLLRGKVSGLIKLNRFEEAFATLLQIADEIDLNSPSSATVGRRIEDENSIVLIAASVDEAESLAKDSANAELTMQLTQWLRWKLNEVYQSYDADAQSAYRDAVAKHLKSFPRDSLTLRHDRLRLFPIGSVDENIRIKMAAELLAQGQYVRANSLIKVATPIASAVHGGDARGAQQTNGILPRAKLLLEQMVKADFADDAISTLEETIAGLRASQSSGRDILAPDLYNLTSREAKVGQILRTDPIDVNWSRDVTHLEQEKLSNYFTSKQHFCEIVATDQPELHKVSFQYGDEFREFQMYDSLGRFVHKAYLDPDGIYDNTRQGTKGRVFLHQSLLLLCIDKAVFAIDWEKFIRGEPALLWHADDAVCTYSGFTNGTSNGISVLSDGMLMCLSSFTGEVLWQRNQVSPRSTIIRGDQSLTIWNRAGRTYDKVDPIMGRLLSCGRMDRYTGSASFVAKDMQLFAFRRRNQQQPKNEDEQEGADDNSDSNLDSQHIISETLDLNLFDYNQQKVRWTKKFSYPAHSALIDQHKLLVLSSDDVFSMIDLRSGKIEFETEIPGLTKNEVSSIVVNKLNGIYVVTVYSKTLQEDFLNQDNVQVTFKRMHKGNAMIGGSIVALNSETGESVWKSPMAVQRFQLLEGLPWDSPFLFLSRRNVYKSDKTSVRIQMAVVDIQSGKLKANKLFAVPVRDNAYYRVICQPLSTDGLQQSVELQVSVLKTKFYLGDVATPPQPVAALTNQNSFKRMKQQVSISPVAPLLATDFQKLTDQAIADEEQRKQLGKEEVRLTELEMKKK